MKIFPSLNSINLIPESWGYYRRIPLFDSKINTILFGHVELEKTKNK